MEWQYELVQDADLLWRWAMVSDQQRSLTTMEVSLVAFPTRAEAHEDLQVQLAGRWDSRGHLQIPASHVQKLVRGVAWHRPECGGLVDVAIVKHPRDATGCNWNIGPMSGLGCEQCKAALIEEINVLRQWYSVPDGI